MPPQKVRQEMDKYGWKMFSTGLRDDYDLYQDCFDEGSFIGKGIYDLKIFHELLYKEIPENKVLSHDLIEGCYLRCGLSSDILVLDDYPSKYNSFSLRQERWTRGDFQIMSF